MSTIRYLTASEVAHLLDPTVLRPALEAAMDGLSAGRADVPPRVAAVTPNGWLGAMPGHLTGVGLAAKLVTIFPGNVGVPSHQGVIVVFDEDSGRPLAILDAEHVTEARTSMTAAIAADHLARSDAEVLTIVGGGAQARGHVRAFAPIRPWRQLRIVNRTSERAEAVAEVARADGWTDVVVERDAGVAVDGADVVALCTHADRPVVDPARIGAGAHVSSVGSQAELPAELAEADVVVVEWRDSVRVPPPAGAAELQGRAPETVVELGDLVGGRATGRSADDQLTVYKSTGHAVQDVAAARLVFDAAVAAGVGVELPL